AYESAVAAGADDETARAVAEAAMVAAAVRARSADPDGKVIGEDEEAVLDVADGPRDLLRISHALRHSPVVQAVRQEVTA
ncbi:hypothetical protein ACFV4S_24595, partial [Streptomyces sp. NPDC059742]